MLPTRGGGTAIDPITAIFLSAGLGWAFGHGNGRCIQCGWPRKDSCYFLFSEEGAELPPGCYGGFCPDSWWTRSPHVLVDGEVGKFHACKRCLAVWRKWGGYAYRVRHVRRYLPEWLIEKSWKELEEEIEAG